MKALLIKKSLRLGIISAARILLIVSAASAQSGVLLPTDGYRPDPKRLSLAAMNVEITIDNQHARVRVVQIFENRTNQTLEGKYVFALPESASIADFAVWEDEARIPGVMMERRRANRIYGEIKQARIDPGILQTTDADESAKGFSARVFPINPYGTKRLEMEYAEEVRIEDLASHFTFPLKPAYGETQTVGEFRLLIRVLNDFEFAPVGLENSPYPLHVLKDEPNDFLAEFRAANIELKNDFAFAYRMAADENRFSVIAYRAPERITAYDLRDPSAAEKSMDGFFRASALFAGEPDGARAPKRVIVLLDTSLSMYADKLARAVEATDFFLHNLSPEDEFNLVLFNAAAAHFAPRPVAASPDQIENALRFVRDSSLAGGTDLKKAFEKALGQMPLFSPGERQIVLISDANPTLGTVDEKRIEKTFDRSGARLFAFALGAGANEALLKSLTEKTRGFYVAARETEDLAFKLRMFFDRVGAPEISDLRLAESENLYDVYPAGANSFFGSSFSFVGRYRKARAEDFTLAGRFGAESLRFEKRIALPESDETHAFLPRVWARARVDALLAAIGRNGEREDHISEIIRLSEKYRLVTPYTAFIAAPRALLRPRLIQPGDPVIRVKADEAVTAITAVLPFGEVLPLKYLKDEKVWQTRFLAPVWMNDGTYRCRLILTDETGAAYEEEKSFVVDSRAPSLSVATDRQIYRAGDEIKLKVSADADTSRLVARIYGAKPVPLVWSAADRSNTGRLKIPDALAAGRYEITVSAEDFAHNQTTEKVTVEVLAKN